MNAIIYKYQLPTAAPSETVLKIHYGAEFLKLDVQKDIITLWYQVPLDSYETMTLHTFKIVWTGKPFEAKVIEDVYLGSAQTSDGLVWHVYDITDRE